MMRYQLSAQARRDLLDIWQSIADDNLDADDKVILKIEAAMQSLAVHPGFGHQRTDVPDNRYRFWSVYSFLLAYRIDTTPITFARIVHGARNVRRLFGGHDHA